MNHLSKRFQDFAEQECDGSSPLYAHLSRQVSYDDEILRISSYASEGQPVPNLLFGAVHYILLNGEEHELKNFYPSIADHPNSIEGVYPVFRDFCMENRQAIIELLEERRVQTNEVRRCAYLYPVFCEIYKRTAIPLSIIEIGTSAGLQLLWDQYAYSYEGEEWVGNDDAKVHLTAEVRNESEPFVFRTSPPVVSKVGIDVNVSDLTDEKERLWLKALIWPEHKERRKLFEGAVHQLIENPPPMIEGDGVSLITEQAHLAPRNSALCIFHTHVANQIPEMKKAELLKRIRDIGKERDVFHIYNNMNDRKLHLDSIRNGVETHEVIGDTDGHGRWFEWKLDE
ncbi:DUF2332 domain-containing protein [Pontibacillus salipaludis]|uniref:DUF2332 domain-containing protein n=1 Tax=Pontibacillus salipaludis TaxID=1697394 RepID=A0ABQ1Q4G0_9BACI|nr:DUF2332 domain-containing protein [Pontibacillus salipaludis]GGD12506.1 hypothetical protein GCM10011389_20080 [Pontibacillus salipaludis]